MGRCLGTTPNTRRAVVTDNTVQGVTPMSPESLEGRNPVNICPNGACEESIDTYTKSRCQWSGRSINKELGQGRYGRLNPLGP